MTRPVKRERASHTTTAATAKAHPGEWVRVGAYPAHYTAQGIAASIRVGGGKHRVSQVYTPAGAFDARVEDREFDTEVYARFRTEEVVS